jgi:hypothetical protein
MNPWIDVRRQAAQVRRESDSHDYPSVPALVHIFSRFLADALSRAAPAAAIGKSADPE